MENAKFSGELLFHVLLPAMCNMIGTGLCQSQVYPNNQPILLLNLIHPPPQDSFAFCKSIAVFQLQWKLTRTREKKEDADLPLVQCQVHLGSKGAKILMGPCGCNQTPLWIQPVPSGHADVGSSSWQSACLHNERIDGSGQHCHLAPVVLWGSNKICNFKFSSLKTRGVIGHAMWDPS